MRNHSFGSSILLVHHKRTACQLITNYRSSRVITIHYSFFFTYHSITYALISTITYFHSLPSFPISCRSSFSSSIIFLPTFLLLPFLLSCIFFSLSTSYCRMFVVFQTLVVIAIFIQQTQGQSSCCNCPGTSGGSSSGGGGSSVPTCSSCMVSNSDGTCDYCPAGKYYTTVTSGTTINYTPIGSCAVTPIGSYSTAGSASCSGPTSCTTLGGNGCLTTANTGATSASACVPNTAWTQCLAGTYYSTTASRCVSASIGYYATAGQCTQTTCGSCKTSPAGAKSSGDCVACPAGQYLNSNLACVPAEIGSYVLSGQCTKTACGSCKTTSSTGATSSGDCTACPAGQYLNSNLACVPAQIGYYVLSGQCTPSACDPCTTTSSTGSYLKSQCGPIASCPAGQYYSSSSGKCINAGIGNYSPGGNVCSPIPCSSVKSCSTTVNDQASKSTDCVACPAGQYLNSNLACVPAQIGYYVLSGQCTPSACDPCTTTSSTGSYLKSQCGPIASCPAGQYYSSSSGKCINAGIGNYSPGGNVCSPIPCSSVKSCSTTVNDQASKSTDCVGCPPGQYFSAAQTSSNTNGVIVVSSGSCVNAGLDNYAAGGTCNPETCSPCTTTGSNTQASKASDCGPVTACSPGYIYSTTSRSCTLAPIGYYSLGGPICSATKCGTCKTTLAAGASSPNTCQAPKTCPGGTLYSYISQQCENCNSGSNGSNGYCPPDPCSSSSSRRELQGGGTTKQQCPSCTYVTNPTASSISDCLSPAAPVGQYAAILPGSGGIGAVKYAPAPLGEYSSGGAVCRAQNCPGDI